MTTVHKTGHRNATPAKQPVGATRGHRNQQVFSKSDIDKIALSFWSEARAADANNNHRLSKAELTAFSSVPASVRAQMKKVLSAALKAQGLSDNIKTGALYAFAKSLLPELRHAADVNGNKDHKLTSHELSGVSAAGKALFAFNKALVNRKVV